MTTLTKLFLALITVLALAYPVAIYWSMQHFEPRFIGLIVAALYLIRVFIVSKSACTRCLFAAALSAFALSLWLFNSTLLLLLVPAFINAAALCIFAHSYLEPPTIPAKFARKIAGELSSEQVLYTNKVTLVWMAFFILNGATSLFTVFYTNEATWALYNGLLAYLLMAGLFIGEFLYRTFVFHRRLQK